MRLRDPGGGRVVARLATWVALLAVVALVTPSASVQRTTARLVAVESVKRVDFDAGIVWVLVLGSDAGPGEALDEGRSDAIQLVAVDARSGRAAGIGVPRDSWVELPDGFDRINAALADGPQVAATAVEDLVGVRPDYVLVVGFDGFRTLVQAVGGLHVTSGVRFHDPRFDLTVRRGTNRFGPSEALDYARSRTELRGHDFERSANQQRLMLAGLRQLRAGEDRPGFMEAVSLAAIEGLDTDVAPIELYRLAQALTAVHPARVTTCVVDGTPAVEGVASVVDVDEAQARRLGADAGDDATLDRRCEG